jgi:hypothetical protein
MLVIPIQSPGLLLKQEGKIFILFWFDSMCL